MDRELGLICVRVPTCCPFRLQVYCNGYGWLERRLARKGIEFTAADNAFVRIADFARAQELADTFKPELLHRHPDRYAQPVKKSAARPDSGASDSPPYASGRVRCSARSCRPLATIFSQALGANMQNIDVARHQKIVVALSEAIRLMAEIDRVIDAHGGWPGAFQTAAKA